MRNINCRNVRCEIEETTSDGVLSSSVTDHLMNCIACGTISREHAKLQQIVSSLGTVEAPGDFDFRLRARLVGEKPGSARSLAPFGIGGLSLPSLTVAAMLLLVAAGFVLVGLRSRLENSSSAQKETRTTPTEVAKSGSTDVTSNSNADQTKVAGVKSPDQSAYPSGKRQGGSRQPGSASVGRSNRVVALDSASTGAPVLKRDQLVQTYPTSAFPIDAAYQSLKVSVDNGRGASRTISLPTVSFGSKQSLSQGNPPLVAAAREAW